MTGDFYQKKKGWLHSLDPRCSILISFLLVVDLFFIGNLTALALVFIGVHVLLWSASIPLKKLFHLWSILIPFMLMILLLWPLFNRQGDTVLLHWRFIVITRESLEEGAVTALRIPIMLLCGYIPLMTHRQNALIRAWVALGVPYRVGLILLLSLRFLPFFRESYVQIEQAQRMRGLNLKKAGLKGRLPMFVSLMVWALRTSENIGYALETRGLGYSDKPTYLVELHFRLIDWLVLAGVLLLSAGTVYTYISTRVAI